MGVCIVTGGGGPGIGSACCEALLGEHELVWAADADLDAAVKVARGLGERVRPVHMEVSDPGSVKSAMDHILKHSGRVDVLVNSAGITDGAPAAEIDDAIFERIISTNLRGPWLCSRLVIPPMIRQGGGAIINISSVNALGAQDGFSVYAASKAGVLALTRGIAFDYGPQGIRCNAVSPGWVPYDPGQPGFESHRTKRQMIPRQIEPKDIGGAVAFLAGDAARAITGQNLVVDAGSSSMLRPRAGA
ncbi:MAG: SDR family NAD(P)-dependent oxidoreductase [Actinomycetota bacterium]